MHKDVAARDLGVSVDDGEDEAHDKAPPIVGDNAAVAGADAATSDAAASVDAFAPSTRRKRPRSYAAAVASKEAAGAEKAARSARCVHCRGTSRWAAEPTRCSKCSTERQSCQVRNGENRRGMVLKRMRTCTCGA